MSSGFKKRVQKSMKWTNMDLCMSEESGEGGGGLNNSHSGPYSRPPCWEQSQHAPSTLRLEGSMATSGGQGSRGKVAFIC